MKKIVLVALMIVSSASCATLDCHRRATAECGRGSARVIDLSYPLATFRPRPSTAAEKRLAADLRQPVGSSRPSSAFTDQVVLIQNPDLATGDGVFKLNATVLGENIGTSIDAPAHFVPTRPEVANPDQRGLAELTVEDLTGPVVLIDISARVDAELKKNNGVPGPVELTNFGDDSGNVVTAADIDQIADQIGNRSFVIAHTGWSQFYGRSGPGLVGLYVNDFNFPGFSRAAIGRLLEIETSRNVRINGLGADNLTVDAGGNAGSPRFSSGAFPAHVRGLQRGWKLLENLTNTGELRNGECMLFVGAMKHVGGVAGWARIFASCSH
jgi:kynurenine formamidase